MTRHPLALLPLLFLLACGPSGPDVAVSDAWARPAEAGRVTAVYLRLDNRGGAPDRLLGASTEAARAVELHESVADAQGVVRMRPAAEGLPIPAGATATLEPGGYHLMVVGLARDLRPGDRLPLTLRLERSGERAVQAEVRPPS